MTPQKSVREKLLLMREFMLITYDLAESWFEPRGYGLRSILVFS